MLDPSTTIGRITNHSSTVLLPLISLYHAAATSLMCNEARKKA
jgi:hypothetical protein